MYMRILLIITQYLFYSGNLHLSSSSPTQIPNRPSSSANTSVTCPRLFVRPLILRVFGFEIVIINLRSFIFFAEFCIASIAYAVVYFVKAVGASGYMIIFIVKPIGSALDGEDIVPSVSGFLRWRDGGNRWGDSQRFEERVKAVGSGRSSDDSCSTGGTEFGSIRQVSARVNGALDRVDIGVWLSEPVDQARRSANVLIWFLDCISVTHQSRQAR